MNKVIATLAVVLTLSASNAFAADGNVTNLDDFGLSSMTVVSDAVGMEVRGMRSYARTSGWSATGIDEQNAGYQEHNAGIRKSGNRRSSSNGFSVSTNLKVRRNRRGQYSGVFVGSFGAAAATAY